jgi:DnaJ-class molecular chaperone
MVKDLTLYTRLGLEPSATNEDIKKAYNTLSKKWHPDKNPDNIKEAEEKFKEITEAKTILMDKDQRRLYDQIGMDIYKQQNNNMDQGDFSHFSHMFNGFSNQPKLENVVEKLPVTLEQLYKEENIKYTYKYKAYCNNCNGDGVKDIELSKCSSCNGKGGSIQIIKMGPMIQQVMVGCKSCNNTGKITNEDNICTFCKGSCNIIKEKTINIPLKSALVNGNKINLSGKGHIYKNNVKTDLILIIEEIPNKIFKRNNNDLYIIIELKLFQALYGFEKSIIHLDGRKLNIKHIGKTDYNAIRYLPNEGMKDINGKDSGVLYIQFIFTLPNINTFDKNHQLLLDNLNKDYKQIIISNENEIDSNLQNNKLVDCKSINILHIFNELYLIPKEVKENRNQSNQPQGESVQCAQQ